MQSFEILFKFAFQASGVVHFKAVSAWSVSNLTVLFIKK